LDGSACAFAYAEFLNKTGVEAVAAIFGRIHREAEFVFSKFKIKNLPEANDFIQSANGIILVDTSQINDIPKVLSLDKVVEIIDHRKVNDAGMFPNAKIQIELVGSAATLISEKFYEKKLDISKESAVLLYSAIVSNTINFKNLVTTERDRKMADFLKSKINLPENYVQEMFSFKSKIIAPLKEVFDSDLVNINLGGKLFSIAQLEIIGVEDFFKKNALKIENALDEIRKKELSEYIFLSLIDIENGFNLFVCYDNDTKKVIEKALRIKFVGNTAKIEKIIMRKEVIPKLKELFQ
jgi:inorganic pyrophosphatase/exopolyphosphatase